MRRTTLEEIAAWQRSSAILEQAHSGRGIPTLLVTCNYFHVFGIDRPLLGRFLTSSECKRGTAAQVVILSEPLWRSRFDANPRIVGETVHLNGLPFTVIGIAPSAGASFQGSGFYVLTRSKRYSTVASAIWQTLMSRGSKSQRVCARDTLAPTHRQS